MTALKWLCATLVLALAPLSNPAAAKVAVVFGVYAPDKSAAMAGELRPSLDRIAGTMGDILGEEVEIRMEVARSYEQGIEMIVSGRADFMRLGPASYVMAKRRDPGLDILAMEKQRGGKTFKGVICVRDGSDITEIQQLRGRSFAFGTKRSMLGRFFSQLTLLRHGIYARDLGRYEYLGGDEKVGRAVGAGRFDAGALEEASFTRLVEKGVPIRAIATFSNWTRPWAARAGLDQRVKTALREALLRLDDPVMLKALRFDGFLDGDDADYDPTRQAIRQNPWFFAETR
jgi:phosphonate transport system substrate-binding protein